jgi:hypothetical protein
MELWAANIGEGIDVLLGELLHVFCWGTTVCTGRLGSGYG